jgi:hypothetical protein
LGFRSSGVQQLGASVRISRTYLLDYARHFTLPRFAITCFSNFAHDCGRKYIYIYIHIYIHIYIYTEIYVRNLEGALVGTFSGWGAERPQNLSGQLSSGLVDIKSRLFQRCGVEEVVSPSHVGQRDELHDSAEPWILSCPSFGMGRGLRAHPFRFGIELKTQHKFQDCHDSHQHCWLICWSLEIYM